MGAPYVGREVPFIVGGPIFGGGSNFSWEIFVWVQFFGTEAHFSVENPFLVGVLFFGYMGPHFSGMGPFFWVWSPIFGYGAPFLYPPIIIIIIWTN